MASGMQAARSRSRASCNKSPAGRAGALGPARPGPGIETAVICLPSSVVLPRDDVIGEVIDLTRDAPGEEVVERQQVRQDVETAVRVRNPLGQQLAQEI